jgi:site-specific DNA recombinase
MPVATLHKILRKLICTGDFEYGGKIYQGIYEPLVSRTVWDRCQEILDGRQGKKHRKSKHDFAFSGLIQCGHCGCSLVGEIKKGRYVYYHCTGYRGKCPEPYTREEHLTERFAERLRELVIDPDILAWLQDELVANDVTEQAARDQALRRHQADLDRLQRRLDLLYDDRLDGRIDGERYDQKAAGIQADQQRIRGGMIACRATLPPASSAVDLLALTSKTADLFLEQGGAEQQKLLRLVVGEAVWQTGELRMSFKPPFEQMRLSNSVSPRNQTPDTGCGAISDIWRRGGDSNSRYPSRYSRFRGGRDRPLCHLSALRIPV